MILLIKLTLACISGHSALSLRFSHWFCPTFKKLRRALVFSLIYFQDDESGKIHENIFSKQTYSFSNLHYQLGAYWANCFSLLFLMLSKDILRNDIYFQKFHQLADVQDILLWNNRCLPKDSNVS